MGKDYKKILILRLSAIGDSIHTLPLASVIKKNYPDCQIGWVVEDKAQLFIKDNPLVDKCYVLPKKEWKKRGFCLQNFKDFKKIIDEINSENYDLVLDTQQLFKTAMILPFLNIKRKIALTGGREFSNLFVNEKVKASHSLFDPDYHIVDRNLELAQYLGMDVSAFEIKLQDSAEEINEKVSGLLAQTDSSKKTVLFAPATTWVNKHWEEKNWSDLLSYLNDKVNVIFTGMECDIPLINRIIAGADVSNRENILILAGKTNLLELAEVFRRVDVVISPDSGSAHIAWAVSKPAVITIFTATAGKRNGPLGKNCYVLTSDLPCSPCLRRKCRNKKTPDACRSSVKFADVKNLIDLLLHLDKKDV